MPFLIYSAYRLGLLFAAAGLLYLLDLRSWLLWIAAVALSLLASYALLGRQRDRASEYLAQRRARREAGHRFSRTQEEDFEDEDRLIEGFREDGGAGSRSGSLKD